MSKTETENRLPILEIGKKMNDCVLSVIGKENLLGFERAYLMADAMEKLKTMLTPEYMKPIMLLQGTRLGFKTDKDKNKDGSKGQGYSEDEVKHCLIEAVLNGFEVTGNQFNIIAGNTYGTKEGYGALLSKIKGLSYSIIPNLPRIKEQSGAVVMKIEWTIDGVTQMKEIDFGIKVNSFMGTDAVIGKATRKARYWLYCTITGTEIGEGEVEDAKATVMSTTALSQAEDVDKTQERIQLLLSDCKTWEELTEFAMNNPEVPVELIDARKAEIKKEFEALQLKLKENKNA